VQKEKKAMFGTNKPVQREVTDQTSEEEKVYQRQKYDSIIEILITAGYFRARISTLSEFDKVVGGLCWCITSSGESVDIDILFQENSSIGQKIALSEAIVVALRKMGCPSPIQPNQIQGGVGGADYAAIYPVTVWLVKKYFERRTEREQQLRAYSNYQFSKNYRFPEEKEVEDISPILFKILNQNKAVRLYKRKVAKNEGEDTRVRSCLLEFGESFAKLTGNEGGSNNSGTGSGGGGGSQETGKAFVTVGGKNVAAGAGPGGVGGAGGGVSTASAIAQAAALRATANANKAGGAGGKNALAAAGKNNSKNDGAISLHSASNDPQFDLANESFGDNNAEKLLMHVPVVDAVEQALTDLAKLDISELSSFEKQLAKAAKEAKRDEALFAEKATKEETEIMKQMSEIDENQQSLISGSQVGNIVGLGADEISLANAAYQAELEESKKQLDTNIATGKLGAQAVYNRQKQHLTKQKEEFHKAEEEMKLKIEVLNAKVQTLQEEKQNVDTYMQQLAQQNKKFQDLEKNSIHQKELTVIKNLISLNESLKQKEVDFKTSCKNRRQDYLEKIQFLENEEKENTVEKQQQQEIEDMYGKVLKKYNHLRQLLAEANQEVASSIRVIDDIPTRTELIQYERRFVELYQQVAWKLEETRKYYDMYNTLETTLQFLQKEVKSSLHHF
jgi:hypothetical protein